MSRARKLIQRLEEGSAAEREDAEREVAKRNAERASSKPLSKPEHEKVKVGKWVPGTGKSLTHKYY